MLPEFLLVLEQLPLLLSLSLLVRSAQIAAGISILYLTPAATLSWPQPSATSCVLPRACDGMQNRAVGYVDVSW